MRLAGAWVPVWPLIGKASDIGDNLEAWVGSIPTPPIPGQFRPVLRRFANGKR